MFALNHEFTTLSPVLTKTKFVLHHHKLDKKVISILSNHQENPFPHITSKWQPKLSILSFVVSITVGLASNKFQINKHFK